MNVKLTLDEEKMIERVIENFRLKYKFEIRKRDGFFSFVIDDDDALDLREFISDYLCEIGFDDEYKANKEGIILESLVDKLFID